MVDFSVDTLQHCMLHMVDLALAEDVGRGDVTAKWFVDEKATATAHVVSREAGVVAGIAAAEASFLRFDPQLQVKTHLQDGANLEAGSVVMEVVGSARSILSAERTALNFLQRLSGIASATRRCVEAVSKSNCVILDTRKTTPGWRLLEKAAVRAGGGDNHRMGLWDRVMVKDNHLFSGANKEGVLEEALAGFLAQNLDVLVQIEVDSLEQLQRFLPLEGVDWILLDNMDNETMRQAVQMRDTAVAKGQKRILLEGSGNMTLERLPAAAATGIDAISLGALTHSVTALDLGLDFQ